MAIGIQGAITNFLKAEHFDKNQAELIVFSVKKSYEKAYIEHSELSKNNILTGFLEKNEIEEEIVENVFVENVPQNFNSIDEVISYLSPPESFFLKRITNQLENYSIERLRSLAVNGFNIKNTDGLKKSDLVKKIRNKFNNISEQTRPTMYEFAKSVREQLETERYHRLALSFLLFIFFITQPFHLYQTIKYDSHNLNILATEITRTNTEALQNLRYSERFNSFATPILVINTSMLPALGWSLEYDTSFFFIALFFYIISWLAYDSLKYFSSKKLAESLFIGTIKPIESNNDLFEISKIRQHDWLRVDIFLFVLFLIISICKYNDYINFSSLWYDIAAIFSVVICSFGMASKYFSVSSLPKTDQQESQFRVPFDAKYKNSLKHFENNSDEIQRNAELFAAIIQGISRTKRGDKVRWLDIGSGNGKKIKKVLSIINSMHSVNLEIVCIEPNYKHNRICLSRKVKTIIREEWPFALDRLKTEAKCFDFVSFTHCIYHLPIDQHSRITDFYKLSSFTNEKSVVAITVEVQKSVFVQLKQIFGRLINYEKIILNTIKRSDWELLLNISSKQLYKPDMENYFPYFLFESNTTSPDVITENLNLKKNIINRVQSNLDDKGKIRVDDETYLLFRRA
ncbi:hypothetical protein [Nitrosomonas marina]|nr:hypothetical protein [Nitrosomonas marina]